MHDGITLCTMPKNQEEVNNKIENAKCITRLL